MNVEALNRALIDYLRSKLPTITGITWSQRIYMDYPRPDATFPRISLTRKSLAISTSGIGEGYITGKGEYQDVTYDFDIWVKKDNAFQLIKTQNGQNLQLVGLMMDLVTMMVLKLLPEYEISGEW